MAQRVKSTVDVQSQDDEQTPAAGTTDTGDTGKTETAEITDEVKAIVAEFPQHETIYVDRIGGVFVPGTPENLRMGAKLYSNPYYKK